MNLEELRTASEVYLAPLLSAKILRALEPCSKASSLVAYLEPSKIAFKSNNDDEQRVVIYRNTSFSSEEKDLVKDFVEELMILHDATEPDFRPDLFTFLPARVITRHLGGLEAVKIVLQQFEKWASRTYEGGAITSSIGIDPASEEQGVPLQDIFEHDFSAVLSNGYDTLLVSSVNGLVTGAGQLATNQLSLSYSPYRLNAISDWAVDGRIALVLNRLGEQLVFRNKTLVFAKRRGEWQYYANETYIRLIQPPQNRSLREAIYQSCLDISYARTGGCIIVVRSGSIRGLEELVSDYDRLDGDELSIKAKTIRLMANKKFQDVDRRLRQEFLALDGATVLTHKGIIIAVGAIISVPSGSEGGGRMAAAKKGSALGLGIKISEDGAISVFNNESLVFVA